MDRSYFNTTHSAGAELAQYKKQAETQETLIAAFFRDRQRRAFSPSQIQTELGMHKTPITSIRRAITNLTLEGSLEKTDEQVRGPHGRPEYRWRWLSAARPVQYDLLHDEEP